MNNKNNVLGDPLEICCSDPPTGFNRTGYCKSGILDIGAHVVCARVTEEFLDFTASQGNDLKTPVPAYGFPGLKPGDRWCLCAGRWAEALEAGVAPPVYLMATEAGALRYVSLEDLKKHAV